MKKCPTCDKTFEDSMRFCQVDGTPLVDDAPVDPYATMVASPAEAASLRSEADVPAPIAEPDDVLDVPESDPMKTMVASADEMREALGQQQDDPLEIPGAPEPPKFSEPAVPVPTFGDAPPPAPPSPFAASDSSSPAVPSPFEVPKPDETVSPIEDEPATMLQPQPASDPVPSAPPFQESAPQSYGVPSAPVASTPEWNPPPVPDAQWQGQQIGSNTPFQPPPAGTGQNKTLSLISMILGILGLTVCCGSFIVSGAAIVLGFMGRSKANQDPNQYGGSGMAMAGIITGIIGLIGGLLVWLFYGSLILSSGGRF